MTKHTTQSMAAPFPLSTRIAALALLIAAAAVTPVRGQSAPSADFDEDGVPDAVDACGDTEPADLAGPDGCTIVACEDGPDSSGWSSHRAYVAYVADWAKGAKASGTLNAAEVRALIRRARRSTCGSPELIRCCVFVTFDDEVGRCRMMTEAACDTLDDRLFETDGEADVEDAGSCLPNPCTF